MKHETDQHIRSVSEVMQIQTKVECRVLSLPDDVCFYHHL